MNQFLRAFFYIIGRFSEAAIGDFHKKFAKFRGIGRVLRLILKNASHFLMTISKDSFVKVISEKVISAFWEAVTGGFLLKMSENSQENTCARASFSIKLQACVFLWTLPKTLGDWLGIAWIIQRRVLRIHPFGVYGKLYEKLPFLTPRYRTLLFLIKHCKLLPRSYRAKHLFECT